MAKSALRTRTPAQRAAIDARADASPRPLTLPQVLLLRELAMNWRRSGYTGGFARATFAALFKRGFAKRGKSGGTLCITPAGRRELARHSRRTIADIEAAIANRYDTTADQVEG